MLGGGGGGGKFHHMILVTRSSWPLCLPIYGKHFKTPPEAVTKAYFNNWGLTAEGIIVLSIYSSGLTFTPISIR